MVGRNLTFGLNLEGMNSRPIDEVNKKMDQMKDSGMGAGSGIKAMMDNMDKAGKRMQKAGKGLMKGVTAPIVGIGTAAVATVSSFDDSMANVAKIAGDLTDNEFEGLRSKAQELGSTTAYSASEAAEGMGVLAASGMEANDVMAVSKDMFDLMSAGSIDADTSASILTNTMAQFGLESSEAGYIVDTFAASASKAKISVDDLEYVMGQAGGSLASMNMDVHESTAAFGHLANAGLPVGQLGTMMNAMSREVKANASEFKNLGVDVYDPVTGKLKTMGDVMGELEGVIGEMDNAQRDAALSSVFSGQAMQGATAWINQGSDAYAKLTDEIIKEKNAAETMAAIQEDTIGGAFRAVKSATEGMMIQIGDVLKGPVQEVAKFLSNMAQSFGELDGPTKEMIVKLAGIAAAIGPVLFVGGKLLAGVKLVGGAIAFITSPIGLAIGAAALLGGALYKLWQENEQFRETVTGIWEQLKETIGGIVGYINELWETHGETLMTIASGAWELISGIITGAMQVIQGAISVVLGVIQGDWSSVWTGIQGIFEGVMEAVGAAWDAAKEIVGSVIEGTVDAITDKFHSAVDKAKEAWDSLKTFMKNPIKGTVNAVRKGAGWVKDKISGSHASGAYNIPYDGYIGELHKGEMVLTASASDQFRAMGGTENSVPRPQATSTRRTTNHTSATFNPTVNITIEGDASREDTRDMERVMRRVFKREQKAFFDKLNLQT